MFYKKNQKNQINQHIKAYERTFEQFGFPFGLFGGPEKGQLVLVNYNLCSKCPPFALTHAWRLFMNANTALSIGSCGKSAQIASSTVFSSALFFGFGVWAWYFSSIAPHTWYSSRFRSGEFEGHSSLVMKSGLFC